MIVPRIAVSCALLTALAGGRASADPTTTVVTHGFTQSKGAWVQSMAEAVIARVGGGSIYRLNNATGEWDLVSTAGDPAMHIALIFNWATESDMAGWGYAEGAADALYAALRDARFRASDGTPPTSDLLTGRKVQLIGHSRGACVVSATVQRLATASIPVDQLTTLDPHPVNGTLDACILPSSTDWGDPVPRKWNNVAFADDYWRADGGGLNACDFDGIPLTNFFNTQLSESALNSGGYSFSHLDVHLWYHGTIDLSANPSDGDQTITNAMRSTWWPEGYTMRGFYYSAAGGGAAMRPADGPGVAPGFVPTVYGGSFDQGSTAGWDFHGGGGNGSIVNGAGNDGYLRLGGATVNPGPFGTSRTHNVLFLPAGAAAVTFRMRTIEADTNVPDDALVVTLNGAGGAVIVGSILLDHVTGWTPTSLTIPPGAPRGRSYTLTFTHSRGAVSESVVDVDDVAFTIVPPCPADFTGDGMVGAADLSQLLGSWGPVANPPAAADLNGDGVVNAGDLGLLLGSWGPCPAG